MAKEDFQIFSSYSEIQERPNFDINTTITLENFKRIVGPYHVHKDDEATCQVLTTEGNCRQAHQKGWLGQTQNDKEGLIGGRCAKKYFNASQQFADERTRITNARKRMVYVELVAGYLDRKEALMENIKTYLASYKTIKDTLNELQQRLPRELWTALTNRAKTGVSQVEVLIKIVEINGKGEEEVSWENRVVYALSGLSFFNLAKTYQLGENLQTVRSVVTSMTLANEPLTKTLKKWAEALSSFENLQGQVGDLQRAYDAFMEAGNLKHLALLTNSIESQKVLFKDVLQTVAKIKAPNLEEFKNSIKTQLKTEEFKAA